MSVDAALSLGFFFPGAHLCIEQCLALCAAFCLNGLEPDLCIDCT